MLAAERIIPERQCTTTQPVGWPSKVQARPNIASWASMCSLSEHNDKDPPEQPCSQSQCVCLGHCTLDAKVTLKLLSMTMSTPLSTSAEVLTQQRYRGMLPTKQTAKTPARSQARKPSAGCAPAGKLHGQARQADAHEPLISHQEQQTFRLHLASTLTWLGKWCVLVFVERGCWGDCNSAWRSGQHM